MFEGFLQLTDPLSQCHWSAFWVLWGLHGYHLSQFMNLIISVQQRLLHDLCGFVFPL